MSEQVKCEYCGEEYTKRGMPTHHRSCKKKIVSDLKWQLATTEASVIVIPPSKWQRIKKLFRK